MQAPGAALLHITKHERADRAARRASAAHRFASFGSQYLVTSKSCTSLEILIAESSESKRVTLSMPHLPSSRLLKKVSASWPNEVKVPSPVTTTCARSARAHCALVNRCPSKTAPRFATRVAGGNKEPRAFASHAGIEGEPLLRALGQRARTFLLSASATALPLRCCCLRGCCPRLYAATGRRLATRAARANIRSDVEVRSLEAWMQL